MYWNDKTDKQPVYEVPDDVVDLAFRLNCPTLPVDHAHALSSGLLQELPWLAEEKHAGVHLIHGAASGNGWYRPEDTSSELLHLSKRTRLRDARELTGKKLEIAGHPLEVGKSEVFLLSSLSTLFARYILTTEALDEEQFLETAAEELHSIDIPCRKLLGGITHRMTFPDGDIFTRSLMVADLEPEQSVRLQQIGLGAGRTIGCGLFIPHKGIKAVKETDEK
jgi:CRISPR-associated protein Cas6